MIATAWDTVPERPEPEPVDPTMELIVKLNKERLELSEKIEKLKLFITTTYSFRKLNYGHRRLLEDQLVAMNRYEQVLVERMTLLNNPIQD